MNKEFLLIVISPKPIRHQHAFSKIIRHGHDAVKLRGRRYEYAKGLCTGPCSWCDTIKRGMMGPTQPIRSIVVPLYPEGT